MIVGGSGWTTRACADLRASSTANALPVACAFRNQDLFDNTHAAYAATSASASIRNSPRACATPMCCS